MAIVMLNEIGVFDALIAMPGRRAAAAELAASTSCSEDKIGAFVALHTTRPNQADFLHQVRLMRLACALYFCEEVDEQIYQANQVTSCLVQPGWKGALRWMDLIFPVAADIRRFLSSTNFARGDNEKGPSAFEFVHGKPMWKVLEEKPEQRRNFDLWMYERKKHEETLWHRRYPPCISLSAADLRGDPEAVLMVDVGGANGSQLMDFKAQFRDLPGRFVLQDLPESVQTVKPRESVEVMAYDFFTPQPIRGETFSSFVVI